MADQVRETLRFERGTIARRAKESNFVQIEQSAWTYDQANFDRLREMHDQTMTVTTLSGR